MFGRPVFRGILAAILLFSISSGIAWAQTSDSGPERTLFSYANRERAAHGIPELRWDPELAVAAQQHAQKMARESTLSHQLPGELDLAARITASGARYSEIAENIAEGPSTLEIHTGWMNSPPHRANLLNPMLDSIGIGVVARDGKLFAVQDFSHSIAKLSLQQQEQQVAKALNARGLRSLDKREEARKICAGSSGTGGALTVFQYTTDNLSRLPDALEKALKREQYDSAAVGACASGDASGLFKVAVLLY